MTTTNVTYDRRSFIINGKPTLILSGSVHYIRVHPSRYQQLFKTFHDAKLNTIETYVFWTHHEPPPPPHCNTPSPSPSPSPPNLDDLIAFITAAANEGLHVILRLGPYVCAEVDYGGLPVCLRDEPGMSFRTFNKPFMNRLQTWIEHVINNLKVENLIGNPIILIQLENEYEMISHKYGEDGIKYLQWVSNLQKQLNLNIPGIMCYGAASGVVETINSFYAHEEIDNFRLKHSDQPPVWTECWTGWYNVWGAKQHKRPINDLLYGVCRFFAQGGSGINYYMWMGGTNIGTRCTMYLQITSYDYDAPINEFYQHTVKSKRLCELHELLLTKFEKLFHQHRINDGIMIKQQYQNCKVYEWGQEIAFVCNDDNDDEINGNILLSDGKIYNGIVTPKAVHIVDMFDMKCLYNTGDRIKNEEYKKEYKFINESSRWKYRKEKLPTINTWKEYEKDDVPKEMVKMNKGSSDYAFYIAKYEMKKGKWTIEFEAADFVQIFVNGKLKGSCKLPLWEDRWENRWNKYEDNGPGTNVTIEYEHDNDNDEIEICLLVSSLGMVKGDWQLGERNMIEDSKGLLSDIKIYNEKEQDQLKRLSPWYSVGKLEGQVRQWNEGLTEHDDGGDGGIGWWECEIEVEEICHSWVLDLGDIGKGILYVNGVEIGRFWDVKGTRPRNGFLHHSPIVQVGEDDEPTQRYYHIPAWIIGDKKVMKIVLFVECGPFPHRGLKVMESIFKN